MTGLWRLLAHLASLSLILGILGCSPAATDLERMNRELETQLSTISDATVISAQWGANSMADGITVTFEIPVRDEDEAERVIREAVEVIAGLVKTTTRPGRQKVEVVGPDGRGLMSSDLIRLGIPPTFKELRERY